MEERANTLYASALKIHYNSISPLRMQKHNQEILEMNQSKKCTSIITNLYRIDASSKLTPSSSLTFFL